MHYEKNDDAQWNEMKQKCTVQTDGSKPQIKTNFRCPWDLQYNSAG